MTFLKKGDRVEVFAGVIANDNIEEDVCQEYTLIRGKATIEILENVRPDL